MSEKLRKIKFGIIGCGRIAQRHAEQIERYGELIAVCDVLIDKAETLAKRYGASWYKDITELIKREKEIDVLSICSPNGLHAEHAICSLRGGFHVLCEKPMAINVHDCKEMIKEAEKANRLLFGIKQNRFNP